MMQGVWPGTEMVGVPLQRPQQSGARSDRIRLTERFTLLDRDTLQSEVTIDDPGTM